MKIITLFNAHMLANLYPLLFIGPSPCNISNYVLIPRVISNNPCNGISYHNIHTSVWQFVQNNLKLVVKVVVIIIPQPLSLLS